MTATMRRNFELFGSFISLDMMKRGLNKMLFPYTAVTMLDESTKLCIACEGIVIGELDEMYKCQADFLKEFAPGRPLDSVLVVAGDGFFDNESISKMGFVNANFIHDQWHLFDSGLSKNLGKVGFLKLKKHLRQMIECDSEETFDQIVDLGVRLIRSDKKVDGQLLVKFLAFAKRRKHYSNYCLRQLPGNRERKGSGISESNNSSLLSYLNDGVKGFNSYNMHAHDFCRDLLGRQSNHVDKTNELLFKMRLKLKVELKKLADEPRTSTVDVLIKAASTVNLPTYERFRCAVERAHLYSWTKSSPNDSNVLLVQSTIHQDAPPRRVSLDGTLRCDCFQRVAYLDMCVHEICCLGFCQDMFQPWHFMRSRVQGSMVGWIRPSNVNPLGMFDFDNEPQIETMDKRTTSEGDVGMADEPIDSLVTLTNPFASALANDSIDVNYLPKFNGATKPLTKKQVEDLLDKSLQGYNHLSVESQYAISHMVLEIEKLTSTKNQNNTMIYEGNADSGVLGIGIPNIEKVRKETRKRLKPVRELIVANSKGSKRKRPITDINEDMVIGVRRKSEKHCAFCHQNHAVNNCPAIEVRAKNAEMFKLSTLAPFEGERIKDRMSFTMPVSENPGKGCVFGSLSKKLLGANFVIHEACVAHGKRHDVVEGLNYLVTFLNHKGEPDTEYCGANIWVDGNVMAILVNTTNQKTKYIFDETIISKEGWTIRAPVLQSNVEISNHVEKNMVCPHGGDEIGEDHRGEDFMVGGDCINRQPLSQPFDQTYTQGSSK